MRVRLRFVATATWALALLTIAIAPAAAQTRSVLTGTAFDQTGAVLPGVAVALASPDLVGGTQTTVTNSEGSYRFSDLVPGIYELTFELAGFQTLKQAGIRVAFGTGVTVDAKLSVAAGESVTVSGVGPVVDVTTAASTTKIDTEQLQQLPLQNKRQGFEVLHLAPGIALRSAFGGARDANQLLIDGNPTTTGDRAGTAPAQLNVNWLQEVQIVALGPNAEYGGFTGAASNMVLRSGSNRFSGMAEYVTTRNAWVGDNRGSLSPALQTTFTPTLVQKYWDSTVQLGGPIKKDRLFFFAGLQYFRQLQGPVTFLPTDEKWPRFVTKINWAASSRVRVEGSVRRDKTTLNRPSTAVLLPEATALQIGITNSWTGRVSWTPTPTLLIDVQNGGVSQPQTVDSRATGVGRDGPPSQIDRLTGIRSVNNQTWSDSDTGRNLTIATLTRYVDGVFGKSHALKAGFEYERLRNEINQGYSGGQSYTYAGAVAEQVVLWAGTRVSSSGQRTSFYAQDTWAVNDRMTVLPGVRVSLNRASVPARKNAFSTNTVDPRLGVAWDLFGDHKTVLRAHYARIHEGLFLTQVEFLDVSGFNPQITARVLGPNQFQELSRTAAAANRDIDPDLKHAYVDQIVTGVERELMPNLSVTAQYIHRDFKNIVAFVDTGSRYAPVQLRDPGVDGVAGNADDGNMFDLFNLTNAGNAYLFLTNPDNAFRKYDGVQFIAKKRYSDNWQAFVAYTWARTRGTVNNAQGDNAATGADTSPTGAYTNPNSLINIDGRAIFDFTHEFKLDGSYRMPWFGGFTVSANYVYQTGNPWGRTAVFRLPAQGNQTVRVEPRGTRRAPSVSNLDFRVEKTFPLGSPTRLAGLYVDVFNLTNRGIPAGLVAEREPSGSTFGQPAAWSSPRTVQVGLRFSF